MYINFDDERILPLTADRLHIIVDTYYRLFPDFKQKKFYNDLKSQGISCSKNTLYDYLDYLQDAYLAYPVNIFTRSERIRRVNPRKIYIIDTELINAFFHQPRSDWGHLLENFVYMELRRRGLRIEYYRTQNNTEVDFITTGSDGEEALYQVSLDMQDSKTFERELRSLTVAMQERKLKKATLITMDHREILN